MLWNTTYLFNLHAAFPNGLFLDIHLNIPKKLSHPYITDKKKDARVETYVTIIGIILYLAISWISFAQTERKKKL